ncbi:MAG: DUF1580 domain-containing protein [Gemmataceae bacterium]|nr:DUF1580 domain-containing protein [Gemmataceae bacterium]
MVDPNETLYPLQKSAALFPGIRPHIATITRWAMRGVGKNRVRLATVMIGGRRYTTHAAVVEFVQRLNQQQCVAVSERQRGRQILAAENLLDAEGI